MAKQRGQAAGGKTAFTLIELVVILTILTVLAGITIPVVSGMITAQRVASCREQLSRIGEATLNRAKLLVKDPEFQRALLENAPQSDGASPQYPNYAQVILHYFPVYEKDGSPGFIDPESLNVLTGYLPNHYLPSYSLAGGGALSLEGARGPWISTTQGQAGATVGSDVVLDPWNRLVIPTPPAAGLNEGVLWHPMKIESGGPNDLLSTTGESDPALRLRVHLYTVLAGDTHERLDVVNRAIADYNKHFLPGNALPVEYWDRDWSDTDTAYEVLVTAGYLERPGDTDRYGVDAWGFVLLADWEASRLTISNPPFQAPIGEPVLRAFSLNLLAPAAAIDGRGKCFFLKPGESIPSCGP